MSTLDTAMNAIGTAAALKSVFGGGSSGASASANNKMNSFRAQISNIGVARTNLFDIQMTPPKSMLMNKSDAAPMISFFAEGASLPGRTIQTQEFQRFTYGPNEKVPYSMQYGDYTIQFIGDGRGVIYSYFYDWMQSIVRGDALTTRYENSYEVGFREDYSTTITLKMYNEQSDTIIESTLMEAFPIQVPDVSLSWGDSSMMQFSVTFAYILNRNTSITQNWQDKTGADMSLSPLEKLAKLSTAVTAISALRSPTSIQDALGSIATAKTVAGGFR